LHFFRQTAAKSKVQIFHGENYGCSQFQVYPYTFGICGEKFRRAALNGLGKCGDGWRWWHSLGDEMGL